MILKKSNINQYWQPSGRNRVAHRVHGVEVHQGLLKDLLQLADLAHRQLRQCISLCEDAFSLHKCFARCDFLNVWQILEGSFSAVSKPICASKYSLVTRCYAKQYEVVLRCVRPCSVRIKEFILLKLLLNKDFFPLKILRISSHWKY